MITWPSNMQNDIATASGPVGVVPTYSMSNPVSANVNALNPEASSPSSPGLRDRGIFMISGVFNAPLARDVVTWILESNLDPNRKYANLTLIINSPGGEVNSAFAIIDAMRGSSIPVHTIGLGQISSCGFLTFIAGAKGHRILTPNTSVLSHQWSWGNMGKEHELLASVKQYGLITDKMMAHYKMCLNMDETAIREKLLPAQDIWLSAEEAKEMGICDEIRIVSA